MTENMNEVLETCGKEIKALKATISIKNWEIETLKSENRALYERIEELEKPKALKSAKSAN